MNEFYEKDDLLNMPMQCFEIHENDHILPVKKHWHYYLELLYVVNGTLFIRTERESCFLSPGSMILLHPKCIHSIEADQDTPVTILGLKVDISRMNVALSYAPKLRSIFRSAQEQKMRILFTAKEAENMDVEHSLRSCIREVAMHEYGHDLVILSTIYPIFTKIVRLWLQEGFNIDQKAFLEDQLYDLYNITEYIDANLNHDLKVTEIAAQCKMSYSYFAKRFAAAYGKSCKEYIEEMRIYKVEELLRYTDFDLTYISQEAGFSDCSHLIHQFKKYKGTTPKQFRLQLQKQA